MPEIQRHPELTLQLFRDVVVVPTKRKWPVGIVQGGVFDHAGAIVPESLLYRNFSQVVFAPDQMPEPAEQIDAPHLFGGYCIDHFGHFLLEGLSRAWATARRPDLPLVWATPGQAKSWQATICSQLGFEDRMQFVDVPTLFKELYIPTPGYRIRDFFHPEHAAFLGKITPVKDTTPAKHVWLSRQGLQGGGRIGQEDALEANLANQGWTIIQPENLQITEQLAVLGQASVIAGVEGSALHLPILLRDFEGAMIVVRRLDNENYKTIAQARDFRMYDVVGALEHAPDRSGTVHHLIDPAATANILQSIIAREDIGDVPATSDIFGLSYYQNTPPRFAPHFPSRAPGKKQSVARRIKRKLLG